jgi:hypothetical protein
MNKTLANEILKRGMEDLIQLAEIISVAHSVFDIELGPQMISTVSECVGSLLNQRLVLVGDLDYSGSPLKVKPWPGEPSETVDRIIREWTALSRDPGLGEICWLELTAEGRNCGSRSISVT